MKVVECRKDSGSFLSLPPRQCSSTEPVVRWDLSKFLLAFCSCFLGNDAAVISSRMTATTTTTLASTTIVS